jgi:hypothetical protein
MEPRYIMSLKRWVGERKEESTYCPSPRNPDPSSACLEFLALWRLILAIIKRPIPRVAL